MSDLELPIRGRTYREPDGPHSVVVRGRDLEHALQHVAARGDCRTLAVISLPVSIPDLSALAGRRLLLVDGDSGRLRDFAEVALRANVEVEWIRSARPPFDRLAAALLPIGAIVLAAGSSSRMSGSQKLLLEFDGKPMVRHAVEAASDGGCHQVVVVYSTGDVREAARRPAPGWSAHCRRAAASVAPRGLTSRRRGLQSPRRIQRGEAWSPRQLEVDASGCARS